MTIIPSKSDGIKGEAEREWRRNNKGEGRGREGKRANEEDEGREGEGMRTLEGMKGNERMRGRGKSKAKEGTERTNRKENVRIKVTRDRELKVWKNKTTEPTKRSRE